MLCGLLESAGDVAALGLAALVWVVVVPLAPPPHERRWPFPAEQTQRRPFP